MNRRVAHVAIRFGYSTRRELSAVGQQIVTEVCRTFFGDVEVFSAQIEWLSINFRIARSSLVDILEKATSANSPSDSLMIDVGGWSYFDPIDPEVHYGIADFLAHSGRAKFKTILIVCSGRLVAKTPECQAYRRIAAIPNATVVFVDGNDLEVRAPRNAKGRTGLPDSRIPLIREIFAKTKRSDDLRKRFGETVIRRPGISSEPGGAKIGFIYDFSNGSHLALELCTEQVVSLASRGVKYVIYRADRTWFARLVEDACSLSESHVSALPLAADQSLADIDLDGADYALFSPVVRSGSQFGRLLADSTVAPVHLWCLGSIDEGNCRYVAERTRKLSIRRRDGSLWNLDLDFEFKITPKTGFVPQLWQSLRGDFDAKDFSFPKYPLSAPAAWAMMLEADFGVEGYGPDRDLFDLVPHFTALVSNNAPFLALLIRQQIAGLINRPFSHNDLVLCVEEPAAKLLAKEIVGSSYEKSIAVTRPLLNAIFAAHSARSSSPQQLPEKFTEELTSLEEQVQYARKVLGLRGPRLVQAIILDETIVSGTTMTALSLVAEKIGLDIRAAISIVQLSDSAPQLSFPLKSLYKIPIPDYLRKSRST